MCNRAMSMKFQEKEKGIHFRVQLYKSLVKHIYLNLCFKLWLSLSFKSCFFIQHKWHVVGKPTQKKETSFSETSSKLIFLGNLKCKPKIFIFWWISAIKLHKTIFYSRIFRRDVRTFFLTFYFGSWKNFTILLWV